jgi:hypothetical protein
MDGDRKLCVQHHPDSMAAYEADGDLTLKAQRAFDLYDEMVAALRRVAETRRSDAWGTAVSHAKTVLIKVDAQ